MSDFITEIKIDENKKNDCYTFKVVRQYWDQLTSSWTNQTTLSRPYSRYGDVVQALHDHIMRWERDNKHKKKWNEKAAEERFNRSDYYQEPKVRDDLFPELMVEVND